MKKYLVVVSVIFMAMAAVFGVISGGQTFAEGAASDAYQWPAIKAFIFASMAMQALYTFLIFDRLDRIEGAMNK